MNRQSIFAMVLGALLLGGLPAKGEWPHTAVSVDGTPIAYEVFGEGEPTLILVHGWSCDGRYWRQQIDELKKNHRLVVMDLAGHGHSGMSRKAYTMDAFGEDVKAVADVVGATNMILIGHSMGGVVVAQAAKLMPGRVRGIIGVDTLQNVEYPLTEESYEAMTAGLKKDFPSGCRQFAGPMLGRNEEPELSEWIQADMASAPPAVAMSAMRDMMHMYISGEMATQFDELPVPVVCVFADAWPVDAEANRRHMDDFEFIMVQDSDHFLMMNQPEKFNRALSQAIDELEK